MKIKIASDALNAKTQNILGIFFILETVVLLVLFFLGYI